MKDHPHDRALRGDPARTACLCDIGTGDYHAVIGIGPDGTEHALLMAVDGDQPCLIDFACPSAPHEQLGPLPDAYTQRLRAGEQ